MPLQTLRGWLLYLSAWIPYAASYYLIFHLEGSHRGFAMMEAVLNVAPAALLGIVVFWLTTKAPWPSRRPALFIVGHLSASAMFAFSWWASVQLLMSISGWLQGRGWKFLSWGVYAGQ